MAGDSSTESIIESSHRPAIGGRRAVLAVVAAVVVCAAVGVVVWRSRGADPPPAGSVAPPSRPSELYASDATTLVARFDTDDPRESCLRAPVNDFGYFCDHVVTWWQAQAAFGADPAQRLDRLRHGGHRIVGSLDPRLQAGAKQRVDALLPGAGPTVFSLSTIEPGSGLIRTMAVNRDFRRPTPSTSPGAAAGAPFMMFTLAAALDSGLPLAHSIDTQRVLTTKYRIDPQSPMACRGGFWCPANTGDPAYLSGRRTMWDAFGHQVTTYFVALQERLGADRVIAMAKRLGVTFRSEVDQQLSQPPNGAAWGGFTLGVSATTTLDLANAYATLAADGTRCDPLPVARVTDAAGRPVPGVGPRCEQVLRPEVARAALDAGRCPVGDRSAFGDRCGAGSVAAAAVRGIVGRPVAGQTGLTENRRTHSVVVAGPQLVTAAMIAPGADGDRSPIAAGVPDGAVTAVAEIERDGLASLPTRDFTAPPQELATAG